MKAHDLSELGVFGFEFDSAVGRPFVIKGVEAIPDAHITELGQIRFADFLGAFYALDDLICEFEIEGEEFCALEPHGDCAFYRICQINGDTRSPHLDRIREHFAAGEAHWRSFD